MRVGSDAGDGLPWHPGSDAGRRRAHGEQIAGLIAGVDEAQREVLDKLLKGSPMGRTRDAAPGAPADRPVPRLLAAGLLRRIDAETVILPRHVGQVLRGEKPGPTRLTEPDPVASTTKPADADASAAGARRRPAPRGRCANRQPRCHTGSRAAQRRPGGPRTQTTRQGHRPRRDRG